MSEEALPRVNELRRFIRVFLSRGVVVFGIIAIFAVIFAAIFAPMISPYDPYDQSLDACSSSRTPSISWAATPSAGIP